MVRCKPDLRFRCSALVSGAVVLQANIIAPAALPMDAAKARISRKATTLYGHVDEVGFALAAAGVTLDSDRLPALVGNVRLGSPAYYGGLAEDDRVISGRINDNKLLLTILRAGKQYLLRLDTSPGEFGADKARKDVDSSMPRLRVPPRLVQEVEKRIEERLADYEVVIVVDTSGSMGNSLSSVPESKWQWCADYIHDFARKFRSYSKDGITLVTFNSAYQIERRCNPEKVVDVFESTEPRGGTDMSGPLRQVLEEYLAGPRSRPLLVAVLTDGMPNLGEPVENVIKEATQAISSPKEIRITFLEVGEEYDGEALIRYLDDYMVHDGAKYDIVESLTFSQLKGIGLSEALRRAIDQSSSVRGKSDELEEQLAGLKQQIAAQRAAASRRQIREYHY